MATGLDPEYLRIRQRRMLVDLHLRGVAVIGGVAVLCCAVIGAIAISLVRALTVLWVFVLLGYLCVFVTTVIRFELARRRHGIRIGPWSDVSVDRAASGPAPPPSGQVQMPVGASRSSAGSLPDRFSLLPFLVWWLWLAVALVAAGALTLVVAHGSGVKLALAAGELVLAGVVATRALRAAIAFDEAVVAVRTPLRSVSVARHDLQRFVTRPPKLQFNVGRGDDGAWVPVTHQVLCLQLKGGSVLRTGAMGRTASSRAARRFAQLWADLEERLNR